VADPIILEHEAMTCLLNGYSEYKSIDTSGFSDGVHLVSTQDRLLRGYFRCEIIVWQEPEHECGVFIRPGQVIRLWVSLP
jgi:hypothetical protein